MGMPSAKSHQMIIAETKTPGPQLDALNTTANPMDKPEDFNLSFASADTKLLESGRYNADRCWIRESMFDALIEDQASPSIADSDLAVTLGNLGILGL